MLSLQCKTVVLFCCGNNGKGSKQNRSSQNGYVFVVDLILFDFIKILKYGQVIFKRRYNVEKITRT